MFKLHGKVTIPKGIKKVAGIPARHELLRRIHRRGTGVAQAFMDKDAEELLQERLSPLLGSLTYANQTSWLAFTNVEMHDDDWSQVYVGSKRYAPEFLHIVLSGRATIVDHSGSYEVALGDVFSFNPNAKHGVSSNSLCVTASFVVPRIQLNRTANTGL